MKLYRIILPAVATLLLPAASRAEVEVTPTGPGAYEVRVDGVDSDGKAKVYRFQVAPDDAAVAGGGAPDADALEEAIEAQLDAHAEQVEEVEEAYEESADEAAEEGAVAAPPVPPLPPLPPIPELTRLPPELQERVRTRVAEVQRRAAEAEARMAEVQRRMAEAQARVAEAREAGHERRPDDVVVMGNSVTVESGRVVNDVVALGGTVTVLSGAVVRGDAVALGGTVELQPGVVVRGDVAAFGGSVVVRSGAVVRGDASSFGGSVEVEEGAIVEGSRVGLGPGAALKGLLGHAPSDAGDAAQEIEETDDGSWFGSALLTVLWKSVQFLVVGVVGLVLIAAVPRRMDRMRRPLAQSPGKAFLVGLLAMVAFVPLVVLLTLSIIGILLIPLLVLAYVLLFFAGWAVAAMVLGGKSSLVSRHTPVLDLLVGIGLFWAVAVFAEIPWIGWIGTLLLAVASLMGIGSVVLARVGNEPRATAGTMHPPPERYADEASGY